MVEQSNTLPKLRVLNSFTGEKVSAHYLADSANRRNSYLRTLMKYFGILVALLSMITLIWAMLELTCASISFVESCQTSSAITSR